MPRPQSRTPSSAKQVTPSKVSPEAVSSLTSDGVSTTSSEESTSSSAIGSIQKSRLNDSPPRLPPSETSSRSLSDKLQMARSLPEYINNLEDDFEYEWAPVTNGKRFKSHVLVEPKDKTPIPITAVGVVSYFEKDEDDIVQLTLNLASKFDSTYPDSSSWDTKLLNLAETGPLTVDDTFLHPCRSTQMRFVFKPRLDGKQIDGVTILGFDGVPLDASGIEVGDLVVVDFFFQVYLMTFDQRISDEPSVSGTRHVIWRIQSLDPGYDLAGKRSSSMGRGSSMVPPKRVRVPL
jgi:hypothetical protein